jgi:hypothetical protein
MADLPGKSIRGHRSIGVRRFLIVDSGSTEFLLAQPDYHVFPDAQFIRRVALWSGSRRFSTSLARTIGVSLSMPSERFIYPGYEPLPDLAVYLDHNDAQGTFRSCSTGEKNDGWVRIRLAAATAPYDCAQTR